MHNCFNPTVKSIIYGNHFVFQNTFPVSMTRIHHIQQHSFLSIVYHPKLKSKFYLCCLDIALSLVICIVAPRQVGIELLRHHVANILYIVQYNAIVEYLQNDACQGRECISEFTNVINECPSEYPSIMDALSSWE